MELTTIGGVGLAAMFFLIVIGVPVTFSLGIVAVLGLFIVAGVQTTLAQTTLVAWQTGTDFVLICIPLFVLMGKIIHHIGIANELYDSIQKWVGRLPGGMAVAAVLSCGAFGAVTGSSVASVATMGSIIRPQLKKYNYDESLATGTLAASGSLAILIPPSVGFIFYGILTDTSIASLFIAGIVPGVLLVAMYAFSVYLRCKLKPELGPAGPRFTWKEKLVSLTYTWPVFAVFVIVIGGIYGGVFTPTEASGIGVSGVLLIGLVMRKLTWKALKVSFVETGLISAMIYGIIISGYLLSRFLAVTGLSEAVVTYVVSLNLSSYTLILAMVVIYVVLGTMLDVFGIMILTIPFVFPIIVKAGIDPVWFGVFTVIMCEVGLLTPPVGVNVFVMHNVAPDVPMKTIFKGIIAFTMFDLILICLLTLYPDIALWLTRQ